MDVTSLSSGGEISNEETTVGLRKKGGDYIRFSKEKTAILERTFAVLKHPNVLKQRQLAKELKVHPLKVKFWFQNKRTQLKKQRDRMDNNVLRKENGNIQKSNTLMRETLKCAICSSCRCSNSEECSLILQHLRQENAHLKKERARISQLQLIKENSGMNQVVAPTSQENVLNQNNETIPPPAPAPIQHVHDHAPNQNISTLPQADDTPANQEFYANTSAPTFATIPVSDPIFCAITPSSSQNIPNLYHANAPPAHVQSFTTPEPIENVPTSTPILDYQDILAFVSDIDQDIPTLGQNISALDMDIPTLDDHDITFLDFELGVLDDGILSNPITLTTEMVETANNAMEELTTLLRTNEPFWFRSVIDGKLFLQHETYKNMYPKDDSLKIPHANIESSKESRIVNMNGTKLVDMLLNAGNFVDLFPTIVKSAQTLQAFESGLAGNRDGALQLMSAEMHILSPLVPTRQFVFLRYCKRVGNGVWVIADASLNSLTYDTTPLSSRRFPSGCMIHEVATELSRVTWVEHVEVDDRFQADQLFRDVICNNNAYGAERWILALERICERFSCASFDNVLITDVGGVIGSSEERKNVMKFAYHMLKMFYGTLDMKNNMGDFPHLNKMNDDGVTVCVRKSTNLSGQEDMIVNVATSFWLPFSPENVLDFLKDNTKRHQWDVLCRGNPVHEIQRIINGINHANSTSILRPSIASEKDLLIMQESYTHDLESLLVYAPIDIETLNIVMTGGDSSVLPLLPSGFTITKDGCGEESKGSLVTLAYQVPRGTPSVEYMQDKDFVTLVTTVVTTTVKKIKVALNCYNLD